MADRGHRPSSRDFTQDPRAQNVLHFPQMERVEHVSGHATKRARKAAREEKESEAMKQRLADIEKVKAEAKQEAQAELEQAKAEHVKLRAEHVKSKAERVKLKAEHDLLRRLSAGIDLLRRLSATGTEARLAGGLEDLQLTTPLLASDCMI